MAAITTTLAIAGLALSGASAVKQWRSGGKLAEAGRQQREVAESAAELQDWNASIADLQAADALARGREEENRFRQGVRLLIGSQRAGIAGGNIDVGFGSALDVQADAAFLGELDALTIRTNAAREAWGFKVEAEDTRRRAEITREEGVMLEEQGKAQRSAARWGAASTVLGAGLGFLETRYGKVGTGAGA